MSEAEAITTTESPERVFDTRLPFELSDELAKKVSDLGLEEAVQSANDHGYGYLHDIVQPEFVERLRATVIRIAQSNAGKGLPSAGSNMLLAKDPVFEEAVLNPSLLTMAEVLCGKGALLSQVAGSIKPKADQPGDGKGGLHADQNWTPAPFPVHNQLVTFCWACDEYSEAAGSTRVVPDSHLKRRHPNAEETASEAGAIQTECPAGSVVFWDGSTWHSGGAPRTIDGERVVVHITYSRLALRPVECYDFLDEDWLEGKPYEMRVLLGREDFLNTPEGGFAHGIKLSRTMDWAKT
ncbi:phytanoyl-CoA dioxygenase family protein [Gammaproteobacteria bacterium]|nr:phytanoyl-CoA dioxygenase family protein [Gammaproteobacteria bacterium]